MNRYAYYIWFLIGLSYFIIGWFKPEPMLYTIAGLVCFVLSNQYDRRLR